MVRPNLHPYATGRIMPVSDILASFRAEYFLPETRLRIPTLTSIRRSQTGVDRCHSRTVS